MQRNREGKGIYSESSHLLVHSNAHKGWGWIGQGKARSWELNAVPHVGCRDQTTWAITIALLGGSWNWELELAIQLSYSDTGHGLLNQDLNIRPNAYLSLMFSVVRLYCKIFSFPINGNGVLSDFHLGSFSLEHFWEWVKDEFRWSKYVFIVLGTCSH